MDKNTIVLCLEAAQSTFGHLIHYVERVDTIPRIPYATCGKYGRVHSGLSIYVEPIPLFPIIKSAVHACTVDELSELAELFRKYFGTDMGIVDTDIRIELVEKDSTVMWRIPIAAYRKLSFHVTLREIFPGLSMYEVAVCVVHEKMLWHQRMFDECLLDKRVHGE